MDLLTAACISFVIIPLLLYAYSSYSMNYWKKRGVVTLPTSVPFGTSKLLSLQKIGVGEHAKNMYDGLKKLNKEFGGQYILHIPSLYIINPEYIKYVTIKDFSHFENRGLHHDEIVDPLNCNLINLGGEKWKRTRVKVSPAFTSGKMKLMFQTMLESTKGIDHALDKPARNQESVDMRNIIFRAIIDNIGLCVFGVDCNSLKNPEAEFFRFGMMYIDTTLSNSLLLFIGLYYSWILKVLKTPITNKDVTKFFLDTIKQTIDYRRQNNIHRNDMMDHFIKLMLNYSTDDNGNTNPTDDGLKFTEIASQAFAFFVAGFETSASTTTYCLLELSLNQKIQEKVRDEIVRVLAKNGGELTYESLMEMSYLDKVVSETLRKYPPLPIMGRNCTKDYTFPETNLTVEKGIGIWISILGIHRDPEYYPDPDTFDPERFTEEEISKRPPMTYFPFGDGPRICIGQRFALLQIKITLVKLLKDYSFEVDPSTKFPVEFSPLSFFLIPKSKISLRPFKTL